MSVGSPKSLSPSEGGPCCPNWDAPTTLYVQIESDCVALDGLEFTIAGAGGTARSWTGTVDFDCDVYSFTLCCSEDGCGFGTPEYPWRLNGNRTFVKFDSCYNGLIGSGFEMMEPEADVTCDPFSATFWDAVDGVACSMADTYFHVSENPFP